MASTVYKWHRLFTNGIACLQKGNKRHRPNLKKGKEAKAHLKTAAHVRHRCFRNAKSARHVNQKTKNKVQVAM